MTSDTLVGCSSHTSTLDRVDAQFVTVARDAGHAEAYMAGRAGALGAGLFESEQGGGNDDFEKVGSAAALQI